MFKVGLLEDLAAADIGYAAVPLSQIHDAAARCALASARVDVRLRRGASAITRTAHGFEIEISGAATVKADVVVVAVAPDRASNLLPPGSGIDRRNLLRLGRSSVTEHRELIALSAAELMTIDARTWRAAGHWPALAEALLGCLAERLRTGSFYLALHQISRIEERVLLALWHLSDRHGKVGPKGVVLELPNVTHQLLSELVAARRPSVTLALRRLA